MVCELSQLTFFKNLFINLFLAVLYLHCCTGPYPVAVPGLQSMWASAVAVHRLWSMQASVVAVHRLWSLYRLSTCGMWA